MNQHNVAPGGSLSYSHTTDANAQSWRLIPESLQVQKENTSRTRQNHTVLMLMQKSLPASGGRTAAHIHQVSDRHEPVIGVVALVPSFLDRGTIIGDLPSESVTTPSHVPNLKQNSHQHRFFRRGRAIMQWLQ